MEVLKHGSMEAWKHKAWNQGITRNHMESHLSLVAHGSMEV